MNLPKIITCLLMLAPLLGHAADSQRKPNIIYVLADDLGWTDLGIQGSRYYETPKYWKKILDYNDMTRKEFNAHVRKGSIIGIPPPKWVRR